MSRIDSSEFGNELQVVFHPVDRGMVPFDVVLHGDVMMRKSTADLCASSEPMASAPGDVTVQMRMSSALGGFGSMVSWLEAVTCGVQDCAFSWDAEGPDGELRWQGPWEDGTLTMSWTAGEHDYGLYVNKAQMLRAFYESFRSFVESERYDPLAYEWLESGEVFALVLEGGDLEGLADRMVTLSRDMAEALVAVMLDLAADLDAGQPRRASLAGFMERAAHGEFDRREENRWFAAEWEHWDFAERRRCILEETFKRRPMIELGEKLRELRSPLVEKWLAEHKQAHAEDSDKQA